MSDFATVDVWPNPPRTSVTLASGYVITTAGAAAAPTDEINNLLRSGVLTRIDPSGVNPNPSPIPPILGSELVFATVAAMLAYPAFIPNQKATLLGYRARQDGGQGDLVFEYGSVATTDGGTVYNSALGLGKWRRQFERENHRNAKWFGAYGDDIHDDTAAIQAMLNSPGPFGWGADFFIPIGKYRISSTLRWEFNTVTPWANGTLRGENAGAKTFGGAILKWAGPSTAPGGMHTDAVGLEPYTNGSVFFQITAFDSIVEHLQFLVAPGFSCGTIVNLGYDRGAAVTQALNQIQFKDCIFGGGWSQEVTGTCDYGMTWDYWRNATDQNTEDCSVERCGFGGQQKAAVWFRATTQPYGTVFEKCFMNNAGMRDPSSPGYTGQEPFGIAFLSDSTSLSLTVQDCDIQRYSCHYYFNNLPQTLEVLNPHAEAFKKVYYSAYSGNNNNTTVNFDVGRYSQDSVELQSYGDAICSWGPGDVETFHFTGDHPVYMKGNNFQAGFAESPMTIGLRGNDLISEGNRYSNNRPFNRGTPFDANKIGRTWSNDTGTVGSAPTAMPVLRGCENGGGEVTITGGSGNTFVDVAFDKPEPQADAYGTPIAQNYQVSLSVSDLTGGATLQQPYSLSSERFYNGFRIRVPTDPGSGKSIKVAYEVYRV